MHEFDLFVFDLDGTLVDTVADLAAGVNHAMARMGHGTVSHAQVQAYIGDGLDELMSRSLSLFKEHATQDEIEQAGRLHLEYSTSHVCVHSTLYPGVRETLDALGGIKTVVTNKPTEPSRAILSALGVEHHFSAICGADAFPRRKPDPMPILAMLERFGADPARTLMIGDGAQDIQAGKAAGVRTCGAAYGFRGEAFLRALAPDFMIGSFSELAQGA